MRAATARASSAICLHKVAEYDTAMPRFRDGTWRKRNHDHQIDRRRDGHCDPGDSLLAICNRAIHPAGRLDPGRPVAQSFASHPELMAHIDSFMAAHNGDASRRAAVRSMICPGTGPGDRGPAAEPCRRPRPSVVEASAVVDLPMQKGWICETGGCITGREEPVAVQCMGSLLGRFVGRTSEFLSGRPMPSKTAKPHVAKYAYQPVSLTESMKEIEQ